MKRYSILTIITKKPSSNTYFVNGTEDARGFRSEGDEMSVTSDICKNSNPEEEIELKPSKSDISSRISKNSFEIKRPANDSEILRLTELIWAYRNNPNYLI